MTKNQQAHRPGTKGGCALAFIFIVCLPARCDERNNRYELYEKNNGKSAAACRTVDKRNGISPDMYTEYAVLRGLRDMSGNGVVTGLTEISTVKAKEKAPDGSVRICPGELYYRCL